MAKLNYILGDTPILLNKNETIMLKNIEDIPFKWVKSGNIEYGYFEAKIWSMNKWYNIKRINRVYVNKKIYRITTDSGILDIVDDNYLIEKYKNTVKLLHSIPLNSIENNYEIGYEEAFIMGLFFINGYCSDKTGFFEIRLIEEIQKLCEIKLFLEKHYGIYLEINSDSIFCISTYSSNNKLFIEKYTDMMYYKNYKYIPVQIMNSCVATKLQFIDGIKYCKIKIFNLIGKITIQSLYLLTKMSGLYCVIYENDVNNNLYHFEFLKELKSTHNFLLKDIKHLDGYNKYMYVYNIETCSNKFQAGIGQLMFQTLL